MPDVRSIHTERKQKRKRKLSLMFVAYLYRPHPKDGKGNVFTGASLSPGEGVPQVTPWSNPRGGGVPPAPVTSPVPGPVRMGEKPQAEQGESSSLGRERGYHRAGHAAGGTPPAQGLSLMQERTLLFF